LCHRHFFIFIDETATGYLSDFEFIVLFVLLHLKNDAYGVAIAREMQEQSKREAKLGSIYAALERLERKGFVMAKRAKKAAQEPSVISRLPGPSWWRIRAGSEVMLNTALLEGPVFILTRNSNQRQA